MYSSFTYSFQLNTIFKYLLSYFHVHQEVYQTSLTSIAQVGSLCNFKRVMDLKIVICFVLRFSNKDEYVNREFNAHV